MSSVTAFAEPEFASKVADTIRRGHSFTPFLGSGVSAPSGILMGQQFTNYLAWVTWRAASEERYDVLKLGWPRDPTDDDLRKTKEGIDKWFLDACERQEAKPKWR